VEVIVFENGGSNDGGERWRDATSEPAVHDAVNLAENRFQVTELGPDKLQLAGAASALKRSGHYRILTHKAWKQPGFLKANAKPIRIKTPEATLDGTIRLEGGRYLHLYVDLAYNPGGMHSFHLKQQRRVRKKELHYFDHPRFSIIAMVRSAAT
jgi:hypothetical protein